MGWKKFKEHFSIKHIVQVTPKGICIGSSYIHDLIVIDPSSGQVFEKEHFNLLKEYPSLKEAGKEEIIRILEIEDQFLADLPVFTYEGASILEKKCEEYGYPKITHDGCLMYENTFSKDRATAVVWAKNTAKLNIQYSKEIVERTEAELLKQRDQLKQYEHQLSVINKNEH